MHHAPTHAIVVDKLYGVVWLPINLLMGKTYTPVSDGDIMYPF